MKRVALTLVLLVVSGAPDALAQSYKCILTNTCKAPPCEFMTEFKKARAVVRAYAKVEAPDLSTRAAADEWGERLSEDIAKRTRGYASKCPAWGAQKTPTLILPTGPECRIRFKDASGNVQPMGLDDFQKARSMCSEVVDADYDRLMAVQASCQEAMESGGRPMTVATARASNLKAAQDKVDSLRSNLLRYLSSCKPDPKLAAELTKLGLDALMKDGQAAREEWQARRVSGGVAGTR